MFSPLLPIGAVIFCLGCAAKLVHQQKGNPGATRWVDYVALAVLFTGVAVFLAGAGLSAR